MDKAEIFAKVSQIIAHILKISKESVHENSDLESLGADSLNRVEFVMELEDTFGVEINDEEAEKLNTVEQAVNYIQKLLKEKGA